MSEHKDPPVPPVEPTTPGTPTPAPDRASVPPGTPLIELEPADATRPGAPTDTPADTPPGGPPTSPAAGGAPAAGVPGRSYREVTLVAIVLGLVIGLVMNASITYAGLKIGFTIVGSAIAAVLGFGILKLFRGGTIVETNITQTVASGVNTANSGVIFTFPVLFLLGFNIDWSTLDFWLIALAGVAGAIMGCAFIIPLRKQMIDIDRLRFPSAVGVATILKSPGAGLKKAIVLLAGITLGAAIYLPTGLPGLPQEAELEELDRLVEIERITQADADRTQLISGWIDAGAAPDDVLARGDLLYQLEQARLAESAARTDRAQARAAATDDSAADAEVERLAREIQSLEARLEAAPVDNVSNLLALRAYKVTNAVAPEGKEPPTWDSLRDTKLGWAGKAILGYGDLNARLPAHYQQNSNDIVLNYDHDQDGDPDRWLTDSTVDVGRLLGLPGEVELIFAIAPFALGAGFITGRAGLFVLAGGILAFFVINPAAYNLGWLPQYLDPHEAPGFMFGSVNRPLGIGMLLGGALMGVLASFPAITEAIKSVASSKGGPGRGKRDEMSLVPVVIAVVAGAGLLFTAADFVGNDPINTACPTTTEVAPDRVDTEVDPAVEPATYKGYAIGFASPAAAEHWATAWTDAERDAYLDSLGARPGWLAQLDPHLRAAIIAIIGVVWIWFAGIIIAQCTGMTDWSPISGMALLTVVLVLLLAGSGAVVGAVMIGVALCVAITLAADMMADLKTGYLVGAKPIRQQAVELSVVGIGPVISMLVVLLIVGVNMQTVGIPIGPGTETIAPQALALEAIITSVQGGETPYALYGAGAGLGIALGLGAFSGLGVLVGLSIYLPFIFIATYGIGVVAAMVMTLTHGKRFVEEWGVPFAAGLIVGEAVLALILNIIILAQG